jgi:hypothetical protein
MNKKLQFKSLLLLAAMLLSGANYVWGQEEPKVTLDFTAEWTAGSDENGEKVFTTTVGDNTYKIKGKGADNFKFNSVTNTDTYYFIFGKQNAYIKLPAFSFDVSKIVITGRAGASGKTKQNIFVGETAVSTETTGATGTNTYEIASGNQQAGTVYTLKVTNAYNSQITKIEIYEKTANTVASPTFTPAEGTYTSEQNVTLACETNGAKIYYTTDGTTPTSSSTLYSGGIPVKATTTINAIAINGDYSSSVVSATYTIVSPKTISEVRSQGTGDVLTQGVVTSCVGTTGYIQDENAAICVYGATLTVGDKVTVSGTLTTYKGLLEITNPTVTVVSHGNTITPAVKTIEDINSDNTTGANALQGMLVKIEDATVTAIDGSNTTIKQGESTILVRSIPSDVEYAVNDKLTLVGNIGCFDAAQIANPTNVVVKKNVKPAINANDVTIEFDATSGEIAYTVDNPTGATLTAAVTAGASWISNIVVAADKITFTTETNEGEAREATITLSYTEAEDKVVTVTQKELGYATLPFAFDGGKADIATTFGLSQDGLGSDYGSNAPKLKFDGSGDCLILRINESARALTFDIKGNSFSDGTFDVQASEDGEAYTTLKSYTELGQTESEALSLDSKVRFIKWIYTNKSNGNVGLGNIKVFNEQSVSISDSKYTTFASGFAIDFSEETNITAYTAKVDGSVVKLSPISGNIVPANTGVILYAETAGEYSGKVTSGGSVSDNEMVAAVTETKVEYSADSKFNYILQGGVFKMATGAKLNAGKAYLATTYDVTGAGARELKIVIDGETTGIKALETAADKNVYDLQGRKVAAPTKGLYIINGKKMIVK